MDTSEKEILIKKWLDESISPEELNVLKAFEDFSDYEYIIKNAAAFKAPQFNSADNYRKINKEIEIIKRKNKNSKRSFLAVAATVTLLIGVYFSFIKNYDTTIFAKNDNLSLTLPDSSNVVLQKGSSITYNKGEWKSERNLTLDGEGFFKVSKGKRFSVFTKTATISVLGTQFNVSENMNLIVSCFEGSVSVEENNNSNIIILTEGKELNTATSKAPYNIIVNKPVWLEHTLSFKSKPLIQIIRRLENEFNLSIRIADSVDLNQIFSGSLSSLNKVDAFRALTMPLNLQFEISGNEVIIKE